MEPQTDMGHTSSVIHVNEGWELNHWCEELNLRSDELLEIIRKVGPSLDDIRTYLAQRNLDREANY